MPAPLVDTGAASGVNGHVTSLEHELHNYVSCTSSRTTCKPISMRQWSWLKRLCFRLFRPVKPVLLVC